MRRESHMASDSKILESLKPQVGHIVAIPLDNEGYGIGLLTHVARTRKPIVIGRFYAYRFETVPDFQAANKLILSAPDFICRVSSLGMLEGKWPILGQLTVPEGGFRMPVLLEWSNVGSPAVEIIESRRLVRAGARLPLKGELEGEVGEGGLFGSMALQKKLDTIEKQVSQQKRDI